MHFHEVGAVDAIGEVVGVALALEIARRSTASICSPLPVGPRVRRRRARPPAAARARRRSRCSKARRCTASRSSWSSSRRPARRSSPRSPTCYGPMPADDPRRLAATAPARAISKALPNVVRVIVGTRRATTGGVSLIEANLDDLLPELAPDAAAACFAAGALDVWTAPVQMKRGRPGFVMSALARPDDERAVAEAMLRETSTLGVRIAHLDRIELEREQLHRRGRRRAGARSRSAGSTARSSTSRRSTPTASARRAIAARRSRSSGRRRSPPRTRVVDCQPEADK